MLDRVSNKKQFLYNLQGCGMCVCECVSVLCSRSHTDYVQAAMKQPVTVMLCFLSLFSVNYSLTVFVSCVSQVSSTHVAELWRAEMAA